MAELESRTQHVVGFTVLLKQLGRVVFVKPSEILNTKKGGRVPMQFISNVAEPNFRALIP